MAKVEVLINNIAKEIAEKALDNYVYEGKTIRQWADEILKYEWIPCSERLPEYEGTYLTTTKNGVVRINHFYPSHKRFGYRFTIAWMSMPEPYREGD